MVYFFEDDTLAVTSYILSTRTAYGHISQKITSISFILPVTTIAEKGIRLYDFQRDAFMLELFANRSCFDFTHNFKL